MLLWIDGVQEDSNSRRKDSEKLAKDVGNGEIKRKVSKSDRGEEGYRANSKIEK